MLPTMSSSATSISRRPAEQSFRDFTRCLSVSVASALVALLSLFAVHASAVTVTSAAGAGANAEVNENSTSSFDGGSGTGTAVNARFSNLDRNEYIALRFDLTGQPLTNIASASLELVNFRTNTTGRVMRFYGVTTGTVGKDGNGVVRGYTAENWNESDIRFSTMPGLNWDGVATTRSLDALNLTDLGALAQTVVNEGASLSFSNTALVAFLQTHTTNLVTILVMQETTNGVQARFASKEASATASNVVIGVVGDFAPRLVLGFSAGVAPGITGLTNQSVKVGDSAALSPLVSGNPTPMLQWRENGTNISGATNASLSLANIQMVQNGFVYSLVASNSGGVVTNSMTLTVTNDLPAFPGAGGYGASASGGRGGSVYHVTNLNDSGAGSLRTGVGTANRTIVFDVSGTIILNSLLAISKTNLTIAGQTAPGDGITIAGETVSIQNTRNVIIRYLRVRAGDINCTNFQDDAFHFVNATNCIADHLSTSWSVDECLSCTWSTNITVQWCYITESMKNSCHVKGAHGYGSLLRYGNGGLSFHHNLYADHDSRNPRPGDNMHVDFVNNVVYNWGGTVGYNGDDTADNPSGFTNFLNYVSNYFVAGPSTIGHLTVAFDSGTTNSATSCQIYQSGNLIDGNKNGILDGSNTGWSMFGSPYTQLASPFAAPQVTIDAPKKAFSRMLAFGGSSAVRDAVDLRIAADVRNQTGAIIDSQNDVGGWPTLNSLTAPLDSDQDGIPNYWEAALGWTTNSANNNHTNSDGYTDLEWYLNWLAGPHALCNRNGTVEVNLRTAAGGATNLAFIVGNGINGIVTLLGDGYTARFTATNNFSGLARFNFTATDAGISSTFGPTDVNILVTTTNAPNTPPTLAAISNATLIAGATLIFTNTASDTSVPAQTLTFSLLNNPGNATLTTNTGIFNWRPTIAQGGSSNAMKIVVTDNGSPIMSATQAFSVLVNLPASPTVQSAGVSNGLFSFLVSGDAGPDYVIQASTNLVNWMNVTNAASPALPFNWSDTNTFNFNQRFYRILLGP